MKFVIRVLQILVAIPAALLGFYLMVGFMVRPWAASWGASSRELHGPLPGDELVPSAASQLTMAVDVDAPPETVWPWLVQMGIDRAGLYTYTWFENWVFDLRAVNADRIHPEWQDLAVGDQIAFTRPESPVGRMGPLVMEVRPNEAIVTCLGLSRAECPGTWQFILQPKGDGGSRLILRSRSTDENSLLRRLPDILMEPGYLTMERKMLLGIKARAEG